MKKFGLVLAALCVFAATASAQVMNSPGFKNTTWTGIGGPLEGEFTFFGVMNTFQTRQDVGKFTIEGMLNIGLLANRDNDGDVDNFSFGITSQNPLKFHYGYSGNTNSATPSGTPKFHTPLNNGFNHTNVLMDSFYLNFLWHFVKNWDFGFGTKLNWQVGPAPGYGGWLWEAKAHTRQGGFSTAYDDRTGGSHAHKFYVDKPGSADVVGFIPYANKYAKTALGVRFQSAQVLKGLEVGAAIPIAEGNEFDITHNLSTNFGFRIAPVDWISVAGVIEGAFEEQANLYFGLTLGMNKFVLDVYTAIDSILSDHDEDYAVSVGAAVTFKIGNKNQFTMRPETAFNFFENSDYTPAWYVGLDFDWYITSAMHLGAWASLGFGSKDKRWNDDNATEDYDGGVVFDIRPVFGFNITKALDISACVDVESRKAFDGKTKTCWSIGAYLTYNFR